MDHLRRLRDEQPVLYFLLLLIGLYLAFRVVVAVASTLLGPLGLPAWAPLVVVVGALALVARRQQR